MVILSKLCIIGVIILLVALVHGWIDANYTDHFEALDRKMISIFFAVVIMVPSMAEGMQTGLIVAGFMGAGTLALYIIIKCAKLFYTYSKRKFSAKS